jgi:hypothetical protein
VDQTTLAILEKVNSFYNNGFGHLLLYTALLFGAIGVAVPVLIQYIQSRIFKHDADRAQQEIVALVIKTVEDQLPKLVQKEVSQAVKNADVKIKSALCGIYMLQGKMELAELRPAAAAKSYSAAALSGFQGLDEVNAQRALKQLMEKCLPEVNKTHLENDKDIEAIVVDLIAELKGKNANNRFLDSLRGLYCQWWTGLT